MAYLPTVSNTLLAAQPFCISLTVATYKRNVQFTESHMSPPQMALQFWARVELDFRNLSNRGTTAGWPNNWITRIIRTKLKSPYVGFSGSRLKSSPIAICAYRRDLSASASAAEFGRRWDAGPSQKRKPLARCVYGAYDSQLIVFQPCGTRASKLELVSGNETSV